MSECWHGEDADEVICLNCEDEEENSFNKWFESSGYDKQYIVIAHDAWLAAVKMMREQTDF